MATSPSRRREVAHVATAGCVSVRLRTWQRAGRVSARLSTWQRAGRVSVRLRTWQRAGRVSVRLRTWQRAGRVGPRLRTWQRRVASARDWARGTVGSRRRDDANIADVATCDDECGIRTSCDTEFRTREWLALTTAGLGVPFALNTAGALPICNHCGLRNDCGTGNDCGLRNDFGTGYDFDHGIARR
jgi:hypothetical protein